MATNTVSADCTITSPSSNQLLQYNGTKWVNGTILPSSTIVGISDTQTLTNKTIDSTTNTVTADKLHSATSTISIVGASAPTAGQRLTASSSTSASWVSPTLSACTDVNISTPLTGQNLTYNGTQWQKQKK